MFKLSGYGDTKLIVQDDVDVTGLMVTEREGMMRSL